MKSTINHLEILDRLKRVIGDRVGVDPARLTLDAKLADIGVDSFALIELVFLAEEEFKIAIPFEGLTVNTVGDVVAAIAQHVDAARTS